MSVICGVDEAGRGPLAGPVTAAAVILPRDFPRELLNDSKRLSAPQRARGAEAIRKLAPAWSIGWASPAEIDAVNILRASLLAMERAIQYLDASPDSIIVDGIHVPNVPFPVRALVRADATVPEVMAASILAKTARDWWMTEYARRDPRYGFERHKGYPTAEHRNRITRIGRCPIHRKSFRASTSSA